MTSVINPNANHIVEIILFIGIIFLAFLNYAISRKNYKKKDLSEWIIIDIGICLIVLLILRLFRII